MLPKLSTSSVVSVLMQIHVPPTLLVEHTADNCIQILSFLNQSNAGLLKAFILWKTVSESYFSSEGPHFAIPKQELEDCNKKREPF